MKEMALAKAKIAHDANFDLNAEQTRILKQVA